MRIATWIVWENEGDTYTLKSASQGDLQLTVKRTDGRWEHLGVGKKDPKTFVDGIRNNSENKVLRIHKQFDPNKRRFKYWDDPKWVAGWKAKNSAHLKKMHEALRKRRDDERLRARAGTS